MAMHAQQASFNADFPNFLSWAPISGGLEKIYTMQSRKNQTDLLPPSHGKEPLGNDNGFLVAGLNNASMFSDQPQSELTCNASGSRKRSRCEQLISNDGEAPIYPHLCVYDSSFALLPSSIDLKNSSDLKLQRFDSASASTSGRTPNASTPFNSTQFSQEVLAQIYNHKFEMDALFDRQNERIRFGMEELHKRHCKSLLFVLEQRLVSLFRAKENELAVANRKNAELEEKVSQMSAENQLWFKVAKNNEIMVSNLRKNIEQVLLQNAAAIAVGPPLKEGFGDSDGEVLLTEDAESFCFENDYLIAAPPSGISFPASEVNWRKNTCRACGRVDACFLVLPCRHLCLCQDCEARFDHCPVCNTLKNACLQVFVS